MIEPSSCAQCRVARNKRACRIQGGEGEKFCPTRLMPEAVDRAREIYRDPGTGDFARKASIQEAECYANREAKPFARHPVKPRLLEICEFSQKMGYKRLGLAFCGGLHDEAAELNRVLESYGFTVVSVMCKVGCVPKEEIGIGDAEKVRIGEFEAMCNPVCQAEVLNRSGTELNILLGLCVGHDSLFIKQSIAPVTVFAVKDRVFGHNPVAALYTLRTYSEWLVRK